MLKSVHRLITTRALQEYFDPPALEQLVMANLGQDHWLRGQVGHPEYHFDGNTFTESWDYIESNRLLVKPAVQARDFLAARQAFGRLTHSAQDFYAHSNYIKRWLAGFPIGHWPLPEDVDPFDASLLHGPELRSGRVYWPFEPLAWIPGLGRLVVPLLPRDSHARMNLDSARRGPAFAYAFAAAAKRTRFEYEKTVAGWSSDLVHSFCRDRKG